MSALLDDPEERIDYLIDRGVLVEFDDGTVARTDGFQADLEVYEDSYLDASDEAFAETVGDVFDLPAEEAAERIEETGMTRGELAAFLALRSFLDDPDRSRDELVLLAAMVVVTEPATPVPSELHELDDDTFEDYLAEQGDVVVVVFKRNCPPCETMKEDLPAVLEALPEGVSVAGVDGDEVSEFRRRFEVSVAPTTLLFADGELEASTEGATQPEGLAQVFEAVYGSAGSE